MEDFTPDNNTKDDKSEEKWSDEDDYQDLNENKPNQES